MFPEITRDEVFRIETPRLWLRWPVLADADALAALMAQGCMDDGAQIAQVNAEAVKGLIATWREEMETSAALHLLMALKAGARQPVGILHTSSERGYVLPDAQNLGLEAKRALRDMVAMLRVSLPPRRNPPMAHQCGFPPRVEVASLCPQA